MWNRHLLFVFVCLDYGDMQNHKFSHIILAWEYLKLVSQLVDEQIKTDATSGQTILK